MIGGEFTNCQRAARWRDSETFKYDLIILAAVILKSMTLLITAMILALSANVTGTTITQASNAMEINPFLRFIIDTQNAGLIGTMMIIPAGILAFYHLSKKILFRNEPIILQFLSWLIFYSVLFNVMHDMGTYVGFMIRWGLIG